MMRSVRVQLLEHVNTGYLESEAGESVENVRVCNLRLCPDAVQGIDLFPPSIAQIVGRILGELWSDSEEAAQGCRSPLGALCLSRHDSP